MMMISVIIPCYQAQTTIAECIESLMAQQSEESFEVLVVNSSADETPAILAKDYPSVKVIEVPDRVFAGQARNKGAEQAQGQILAFIDADCVAPPDWLVKIASWHRRGFSAVGGSLVNGSADNIFSRAEYPLELQEFSPRNPAGAVGFLSAANCSFDREVFERHGGFPEIRAGEDLIFCHRLAGFGVSMYFDPQMYVSHRNDISALAFLKKQLMHGRHSFNVRNSADLPGSFLNNRLLFPLLLPALPFIRAVRVFCRSLTLRNRLFYDILLFSPIFFLGCLLWSAGYAVGYLAAFGGSE